MLRDLEPGAPVWVTITTGRQIRGRVVQMYDPARGLPRVLVRLTDYYGAYQAGSVVSFIYLRVRRRDVDRRKERSWRSSPGR